MAERYEKGKMIGEGGFGEVYQAVDKQTKKVVALKRIKQIDQTALNEVETLQKAKGHPNIANIDTYFISEGSLWLVTEFCNGSDLNKYFWQAKPNLSTKYLLMTQMANAIAFLHEKGIAHRDIKPENVLINLDATRKPTAKLTDFGLAKLQCGDQMTGQYMSTCAGTAFFMAPEVLTSLYTVKADIFSMGVIFRAMIFETNVHVGSSGRYLVSYTQTSEGFIVPLGEVLASNPRLRIKVPEQALSNASARQLFDNMIESDPLQRLGASAVVKALSSLKPDNFKPNITGQSPQSQSDDQKETAGQQLLSRLTTTVKSNKPNPSQSKSEAAAELCKAIAAQFSKAELLTLKEKILVLYVMVCRNSTSTERPNIEKWIRPVLRGIDQLLRGETLAGSDAAQFAIGWLQFTSMINSKK